MSDRSASGPAAAVDAPTVRGRFRRGLLAVLATTGVALAVFLIYSGAFDGPFVLDDERNILENHHIRLTDLTTESLARAGTESPIPNRFVANISFALNYFVHGYDVAGYRLVNILIHIVTGILLYHFARTTLALPALRERYPAGREIALFTALIWLVHPLGVQSVAYVVQRMNSLSAMFYMLSLLLYVRARLAGGGRVRLALFAGCALSGLLALGSKEIAATLPMFMLLYEWFFFQNRSLAWLKRRYRWLLGLAVLSVVTGWIFLGTDPLRRFTAGYAIREFDLIERSLTQFRVVCSYLGRILLPHPSRLSIEHDYSVSRSLIDPPTTLLAIVALAGIAWLAIRTARQRPLVSFCILWFLGNLVIESSILPLEIYFEHRTYLPSVGVVLLGVALTYRQPFRRAGVVGLCAVIAIFSIWAHRRAGVWSDAVTFYSDVVAKAPALARGHGNLGKALADQGRSAEAIDRYAEALRIEPRNKQVHINMGNALLHEGRTDEGYAHLRQALRIDSDSVEAHYNLGVALARDGRLEEALEHYEHALRIDPNDAQLHNNTGSALARTGRVAEAVDHFVAAIDLLPGYGRAYANLAGARFVQERYAEAWEAIKKARRHGFAPPGELVRALSEKMPEPAER